jgi:5'-nucleotidase
VNKIVLMSHLGYAADQALAPQLDGVDVIIGGDSHTLLGPDSMKGFGLSPAGAYPTAATDKAGRPVCIAQAWQYAYAVGALDVSFDAAGQVAQCSGKPQVLVGDSFKVGNVAASVADADAYRSQLDASGVFRVTTPSAPRPRRWLPSRPPRTPSAPRWPASPPTTCACAACPAPSATPPAPAWATSATRTPP